MRLISILFLLTLVVIPATTGWAAPRVVASIKPVHALLSGIMQGVAEPDLLMASSQSLHHYSLKPSERRLLAEAELIFWIGPGLESFMPRLIESLDSATVVITLIETSGLVLLPLRSADAHAAEHEHDGHHAVHDPHIWLNNIEKLADEITRQLVRADPVHKTQYEKNNEKLKQQNSRLRQQLHQQLDGASRPFLTYHDGYQYFEQEFGLNNAGFVSTGADIQPGAAHIRQLKNLIQQRNIQCVFYDAPHKPPILNSLLSGSSTQTVALDASGMMLPAGRDNLFLNLQSLGEKFSGCLRVGK